MLYFSPLPGPTQRLFAVLTLKVIKKSQACLSNIHVTINNRPTVTNIRWMFRAISTGGNGK